MTLARDRPQNRRERRARIACGKRERRELQQHRCALDESGEAAGVDHPIGMSVANFHQTHRALGEASCPRCPICEAARARGIPAYPLGVQAANGQRLWWAAKLQHEREKAALLPAVGSLCLWLGRVASRPEASRP